jgi:hypothetical protein
MGRLKKRVKQLIFWGMPSMTHKKAAAIAAASFSSLLNFGE